MKDKEETECKEAEQVDMEEKSKKKKKKKRKHDNERDSNTQDINDEQLSDKQETSVRQSIDSKNSESGNGIALNSSSMKEKKKTKCKDAEQIEVEEKSKKKKKKRKVENDDDERYLCTQVKDEEPCNVQKKSGSSKQSNVSETGESGHIITSSGTMQDKEKTECKDDKQTEEERSKKKKKKRRKVEDDNEEKDSCIRDGGDELSNKQLESGLKQAEIAKNSESDHRLADSRALKNEEADVGGRIEVEERSKKKKKRKNQVEYDSCSRGTRDEELGDKRTECFSLKQKDVGKNSESDHRATNTSGALKNQEKTECKDAGQIEIANKKKKKKRKGKVQEDDEKDFCARTEDGKNSGSDHRATNSGAPKDTVKTECKDAGQIQKAEKSEKKKNKRKSEVQEDDDDDEKGSCAQSRDEERAEFQKDTESSDIVNNDDCPKGIEKTKCKNDAKKKKKKRKREECSNEAEDVLNDAGDYCTEGQERPAKKSKDNGRTENKKSKKLTEKPDLSEEKDEAGDSQWQSAEFGNTAQKEKFLRLMGAYKPCNKERSASSSYSVMAMNKQQEKAVSFSLEKQFLQAMQTRKERGTGLGYQ